METMKRWKAILLGTCAALALAAPAAASHDHYLVTPGTCVGDIARGQTTKGEGEGGYHRYHEHVHLGMPGMEAYANEHNPVAVYKEGTGPGCE
jgi:hypothetical protein